MYFNDISRFSDDLRILSKQGMNTSVSIVTCLNFILVVIALAFTTSIYCRIMLLDRSASVLDFGYASTTPIDSTPMLPVDNTYLFIFISFAVFVISFIYARYHFQNEYDHKKIPHTKVSVVLFRADRYLPLDVTHTGVLATDLTLVPEIHPKPDVTCSVISRSVRIEWERLSLKSHHDYSHQFPKQLKKPLRKLFIAKRIINN